MESWRTLFERAEAYDVDETAVREAIETVREDEDRHERRAETSGWDGVDGGGERASTGEAASPPAESNPARVVADADVLAADLLVGGDARDALDHLREHSWTTLLASGPLLDDAEAVLSDLTESDLAAAWRERAEAWVESVAQPPGDHPALATAYRGGAMHLLSYDERLLSAKAGAALGGRLSVSARHPRAFATLFDAESLYREVVGDAYPGPDRDPRE
ncbi:DUF7384 family protein [Halobellus sp. GM3]|uniref:DUF7384 family protein n=1 Tax=Halobellus sp. GM3 TaxID=3458410 RepID=UPI00403E0841